MPLAVIQQQLSGVDHFPESRRLPRRLPVPDVITTRYPGAFHDVNTLEILMWKLLLPCLPRTMTDTGCTSWTQDTFVDTML